MKNAMVLQSFPLGHRPPACWLPPIPGTPGVDGGAPFPHHNPALEAPPRVTLVLRCQRQYYLFRTRFFSSALLSVSSVLGAETVSFCSTIKGSEFFCTSASDACSSTVKNWVASADL